MFDLNTKSPADAGVPDQLLIAERKRVPRVSSLLYGDAAISNATIHAKIRYDNFAHVRELAAGNNFAFKIAAKPLQIHMVAIGSL